MFCFVKTEKLKKTNLTTTNAILNGIISLKEKKIKLFYILNNTKKKTKSYVCILFKLCLAKIVCKKS